MSVGLTAVKMAVDVALGVKAITDRSAELRSDSVAEPDDLPLHCETIVTDDGDVVVAPEDAADEISQWLEGCDPEDIDGATITSDTLLNLEGVR